MKSEKDSENSTKDTECAHSWSGPTVIMGRPSRLVFICKECGKKHEEKMSGTEKEKEIIPKDKLTWDENLRILRKEGNVTKNKLF